ncbi:MAG TPA: TIGR01440 family protein [Syntrophomonadaceae bacterium]|nr:TIGR01440 family protein [Syntrophomonadaceae bacterium]
MCENAVIGGDVNLKDVTEQAKAALHDLLQAADLKPGQILVVGGSTSEVLGRPIGSATSLDVANAILDGILPQVKEQRVYLAVQCCEHLNRALVVEKECADKYGLEVVSVYPHAKGGGGLAAAAMKRFENPVVVESIKASAGMDIGDVFIGMHIKSVGVVVRSKVKSIGFAHLSMIRTRPKLIGGARARYSKEECE